jgi:hypothetical protein
MVGPDAGVRPQSRVHSLLREKVRGVSEMLRNLTNGALPRLRGRCGRKRWSVRAAWLRMCYLTNMRTPSKIEAAGGPADTSKQPIEADSIAWKREYKGCMVTIFGSPSAGWNVKIDKRESIILGYTRPRAIKYAKELIDEEQAKFHSRSAGGLPRHSKVSPESARRSSPTVTSADRRRG